MNFDLGPYSDFIWPAYAVSVLGLLGATALTIIAWRKAKARLERLERK
jgi:heme exporter protein CcmD